MIRNKKLICVALCVGIGFMAAACGKKAPPLPPLKNTGILNPPANLKTELNGTRMTLKWSYEAASKSSPKPEGFEIFSAVKAPEDCQGCPFAFKSVGVVPLPDLQYQQELLPGYRYYFRIQTLGPDNRKSQDSDTIMTELDQPDSGK